MFSQVPRQIPKGKVGLINCLLQPRKCFDCKTAYANRRTADGVKHKIEVSIKWICLKIITQRVEIVIDFYHHLLQVRAPNRVFSKNRVPSLKILELSDENTSPIAAIQVRQ